MNGKELYNREQAQNVEPSSDENKQKARSLTKGHNSSSDGKSSNNSAISSSPSDSSEVVVNQFVNDGSFLANFLAQQAAEQVSISKKPVAEEAAEDQKKPPAKHGLSPSASPAISQQPLLKKQKLQSPDKTKEDREEASGIYLEQQQQQEEEDDDEESIRAKEEFLQAMRIMEEAGLVTEKGMGAGMVK